MKAFSVVLCVILCIIGSVGFCLATDLETYTNSIGMEFVLVPAGSFQMQTHKINIFGENIIETVTITISEPFFLGKYEVTQEQWVQVMGINEFTGTNPSAFPGRYNPVENVSWFYVQEFIRRLDAMDRNIGYRLPTEMEWELAARGGTSTDYFFGETADHLGDYAWYSGNSEGRTQAVGQKLPNPYGLYDMYGNVREWVSDWYEAYPSNTQLTDYRGPESGFWRVNRGGSWDYDAAYCQSAYRHDLAPGDKMDDLGFRLILYPVITPTYYTNSIGMDFVLIPSGSFLMGSDTNDREKPVHNVTITSPFFLGQYQVTHDQWEVVMGSNPSRLKGGTNPVEQVSWNDVQEFIRCLNAMEGHDRYRLPTEAEWEYAARAGTSTDYFFGDDAGELSDYAWFNYNSEMATHPVGQKLPNTWGLYDVHGNVFEWVQDWYGSYTDSPAIDPKGPETGSGRVLRGGSWFSDAEICRSASRYGVGPDDWGYDFGFRLALSPE